MKPKHTITAIIPAYKAEATLARALHSIAGQTIINDIITFIIVDGEPEGKYDSIIKPLQEFMAIKVFYLAKNSGPGAARQVGVENVKTPYLMFVDADDTLANPFAAAWLLRTMEDKSFKRDKPTVIVGQILEEHNKDTFSTKTDDFTWLTGKLYRTSYIKKHEITFPETYIGEDAGFLRKIQFQPEDKPLIVALDAPVYYWFNQAGSTMRQASEEDKIKLKFVKAPKGVFEATKNVVRYFYDKRKLENNEEVYKYIVCAFVNFMVLYDAATQQVPEEAETILGYAKDIYKLFILIDPIWLMAHEAETVNRQYHNTYKWDLLPPAVATITYGEFKKMMPDLEEVRARNLIVR